VELTLAQGASTETAHFIRKHYITFTGDLTAYCATRRTRNATWQTSNTLTLAHTNTIPTSRLPHIVSPVYVKVPQFMGSFNTCIIRTHYVAQCWKQVPPDFGNTPTVMERLEQVEMFHFYMRRHGKDWNRSKFSTSICPATVHLYGASYNTATETKFTFNWAPDSCNLRSDRFNEQFRLRHGSATRGRLPK